MIAPTRALTIDTAILPSDRSLRFHAHRPTAHVIELWRKVFSEHRKFRDALSSSPFPALSYICSPNEETMAQDPQAQAIRKRKATLKIARLKAAAEAAPAKAAKKERKPSAKA